jgi:hypothetical protein
VYARSTTLADTPLVFMPENEAPRFRAAARSGELVCPVPGCPSPQLTTRGPSSRRHHFVHTQAPNDPDHQRAYVRRVATELLVAWIRDRHPSSTVETDVLVAGITVTALVTGPKQDRFAVMFVDRRIGVDTWWSTDAALERAGVLRGWIFAPRLFLRYPQPSRDAGAEDPALIDRERGDVVLDRALFREMRAEGQWPLLLNINTREVANLVAPAGRVARALGLKPPASGDRVQHLVPSPLRECQLCRDGIATAPIGAEVLAAPRHDKQRAAADALRELAERKRKATPETIEEPRLSASAVRDALEARGPVTTFGTLITDLALKNAAEEKWLREVLYNLRIEGVIAFDGPLGRFSGIRHASH